MRGSWGLFVAASLLLSASACPRPRHTVPLSPAAGPTVGLYRAELRLTDGRDRSFRVLLFAAVPDRLHAELLGPMSRPVLILDSGGGRVALTFVRDGQAFVGDAAEEIPESVLGLPLRAADLVAAVLGPPRTDLPVRVVREADDDGPLPRRLRLESSSGALELVLQRRLGFRERQSLGTGTAPPGVSTRPLAALAEDSPGNTWFEEERP